MPRWRPNRRASRQVGVQMSSLPLRILRPGVVDEEASVVHAPDVHLDVAAEGKEPRVGGDDPFADVAVAPRGALEAVRGELHGHRIAVVQRAVALDGPVAPARRGRARRRGGRARGRPTGASTSGAAGSGARARIVAVPRRSSPRHGGDGDDVRPCVSDVRRGRASSGDVTPAPRAPADRRREAPIRIPRPPSHRCAREARTRRVRPRAFLSSRVASTIASTDRARGAAASGGLRARATSAIRCAVPCCGDTQPFGDPRLEHHPDRDALAVQERVAAHVLDARGRACGRG